MIEELKEALTKVGIKKLTELQNVALKKILLGVDVLIVAPTGSGKTEAAVIPVFQRIIEKNYKEGIVALYITPLRALNRDMLRRLRSLAKFLGISIEIRHGDTPERERVRQSKNPPQVLITTPETFQLLFLGKKLRKALKNVKFVIVDEVHELADSERGVQLVVGLSRLKKLADYQLIALSATVSEPKTLASFLGAPEAEIVEGEMEKEYRFEVLRPSNGDFEDEVELIKDIVEKHTSTLIFVNTRQTAEALGIKLKKLTKAEVHHGSLSRDARVEAEEKFARKELKAMICTSSMELGIDIGHVDVVVQYGSPRQVVRLIQRVGRSGHGLGRKSVGYIIASTFDDILESIAIIRRAKMGLLEKPEIHYGSLDVLANQICALALEYGRISVNEAYEIVSATHPFKDLTFEEFCNVCSFLAEIGRIFYDGEEIVARRRTRWYFYDNISMIPDEKKYTVVDITTGRTIGTLDESFLSTFSGEIFAMKGELWRVVGVDEVVKVEPVSAEGEIPSWAGEEIPVPFEVAQDVGKLRNWIAGLLRAVGRKKTIEFLLEEFNINRNACEEVVNKINEHVKKGFVVPSDTHLTIEGSGDIVVVNACFGHKVNEALGRILALLLSAREGKNVSVEIDPYRVKLYPAKPRKVLEVLLNINPDSIEYLAERALVETKLMQWKVVNAARKFGLLDKRDDLSRINLKNLVIKLRETLVYREALREIFLEKFDIEKLKEIVENLGTDITYSVYDEVSPIGMASRQHEMDILTTKPAKKILEAFKNRIDNEVCKVHCLNCGATYSEIVKNFRRFACIKCGSRMIAVYSSKRKIEVKKEELFRIANLVISYGKKAVYALNAYGVGAETAARILSKYYSSDEEFFKALLEAEKNYIRTRKFWD